MEDQYPELTYIAISCRDENGLLFQCCDDMIQVTVEGALESWLGTGNPKPLQHYMDMQTALWQGRALLIIRKDQEKIVQQLRYQMAGNPSNCMFRHY